MKEIKTTFSTFKWKYKLKYRNIHAYMVQNPQESQVIKRDVILKKIKRLTSFTYNCCDQTTNLSCSILLIRTLFDEDRKAG